MPIRSGRDRVLWAQVHEERIKTKPREGQSREGKQPTRIERSRAKLSWHDWVFIKVHPQIRITNRTFETADPQRYEVQMGSRRE